MRKNKPDFGPLLGAHFNRRYNLVIGLASSITAIALAVLFSYYLAEPRKVIYVVPIVIAALLFCFVFLYGGLKCAWEWLYGKIEVYGGGFYIVQWRQPPTFVHNIQLEGIERLTCEVPNRRAKYCLRTSVGDFSFDSGLSQFDILLQTMEERLGDSVHFVD